MLPNNTYFAKKSLKNHAGSAHWTTGTQSAKPIASLVCDTTKFLNSTERLRKKVSCSFLLVKKDSGKPETILHSTTENKAESVATLPPFGPIEGQKWFDQISSQ
jgi:hypothetical protein